MLLSNLEKIKQNLLEEIQKLKKEITTLVRDRDFVLNELTEQRR
jgi:hypothetical protein